MPSDRTLDNAFIYAHFDGALEPVDGDTIRGRLDMGFGVIKKFECRILGVDTPESHTHMKVAHEAIMDRILAHWFDSQPNGMLQFVSYELVESEKYGRVLGDFRQRDPAGEWEYYSEWLLRYGLAHPYHPGISRQDRWDAWTPERIEQVLDTCRKLM